MRRSHTRRAVKIRRFLAAALALVAVGAEAQTIGGSASLPVSNTSHQVALPSLASKYPAILLQPALGTNVDIFYAFGESSAVSATTSSAVMPSGGMCLGSIGAYTNIAAITASGAARLYITQMSSCPMVMGSSRGAPQPCASNLDLGQACGVLTLGDL